MTTVNTQTYEIEGRELIAQSDGLRVQVLTVGPGQCVPWHQHTRIADTFFCLEGPMVVETRVPGMKHVLEAGGRISVSANRPHTVYAPNDGRCQFVIVQGVGKYDYVRL